MSERNADLFKIQLPTENELPDVGPVCLKSGPVRPDLTKVRRPDKDRHKIIDLPADAGRIIRASSAGKPIDGAALRFIHHNIAWRLIAQPGKIELPSSHGPAKKSRARKRLLGPAENLA